MKILHVISGLDSGGAENVLLRLIVNDPQNEHMIINLKSHGALQTLTENRGIIVHCMAITGLTSFARSLIPGVKLIRSISPDLIQGWMYHGDLWAALVGFLAGVRDIRWNVRNGRLSLRHSSFLTLLVVLCCSVISRFVPRGIIYCSRAARQTHNSFGYGNINETVIHNGFDLEKFRPDENSRQEWRSAFGFKDEVHIFGCIGRLHPQKNHTGFVSALGHMRTDLIANNIHIVFVGGGEPEARDELLALIDELQLNSYISLIDHVSDVGSVMNGVDFLVMPSIFGESFPNVVAEAMACGTPCIANLVGGVDVIIGETGWIINVADPESIKNSMLHAVRLRSDSDLFQAMKEASVVRITETFPLTQMIDEYRTFWRLHGSI